LLVLISVELLDTLTYVKKDVIHVRAILEVALIAMARKVIIVEPTSLSGLTMFGMAALILALGVAFYFERQTPDGVLSVHLFPCPTSQSAGSACANHNL